MGSVKNDNYFTYIITMFSVVWHIRDMFRKQKLETISFSWASAFYLAPTSEIYQETLLTAPPPLPLVSKEKPLKKLKSKVNVTLIKLKRNLTRRNSISHFSLRHVLLLARSLSWIIMSANKPLREPRVFSNKLRTRF